MERCAALTNNILHCSPISYVHAPKRTKEYTFPSSQHILRNFQQKKTKKVLGKHLVDRLWCS